MLLSLSNTNEQVELCSNGHSFLQQQNLLEGWRLHSAGYAVYQYLEKGKIQTLYLHKYLAKNFVTLPSINKRLFVSLKNKNKLDCRIENLIWATMSELRRHQKPQIGFRGVSKDGRKYRAVLYDNGQRIYLGTFDTAEAAARAYDTESLKRFGKTNSLNLL
jgi:hypothetical protein